MPDLESIDAGKSPKRGSPFGRMHHQKSLQGQHGDCGGIHPEGSRGDLFEVDTVKPYADDYYVCIEEAKKELHENARSELKKYLDSIEEYDNIFIAGSCWWAKFPCAILALIERLDFTDKKVI